MSRLLCFLTIILSIFHGICGVGFKQERAKVLYVNPKYVKDLTMFTFRENRRSPYMTSLNVTVLVPIGDNVTLRFEFKNLKLQAFPVSFEFKTCEGLEMKWIKDWIQTYSDIPLKCPVMPGTYHITKFELPPKNFPIPFNNVDYSGKSTIYVPATKEKVCELGVELRSSTNG